MSNALDRSRKDAMPKFLFSSEFLNLVKNVLSANSQEWPFLNPNWVLKNSLLTSKYLVILEAINDSKTFESGESTDIGL